MLSDPLLEFGERFRLQDPEAGQFRRRNMLLVERSQVKALMLAESVVRNDLDAAGQVSYVKALLARKVMTYLCGEVQMLLVLLSADSFPLCSLLVKAGLCKSFIEVNTDTRFALTRAGATY